MPQSHTFHHSKCSPAHDQSIDTTATQPLSLCQKIRPTNAAKIADFFLKKKKKQKKEHISLNIPPIPYLSPLKMLPSSFPVDPAHCHPATATLSKDTPTHAALPSSRRRSASASAAGVGGECGPPKWTVEGGRRTGFAF
jgi:hypothetical protein